MIRETEPSRLHPPASGLQAPASSLSRLMPRGDPLRLFVVLTLLTCFFGLKGRFIHPDSAGYFMFITSAVLDGDLDYSNDVDRFGLEPVFRRNNFRPGSSGRTMNPFAIGSALMLAPFFLLAHPVAWLLRELGLSNRPLWYLDLDGIYYLTLVAGNALLTVGALYGLFFVLRRRFSAEASLWAVLLCWFATPLPCYIYLYGNHSHAASAATGILTVALWLATERRTDALHYGLLGAAAGLCGLVRWQDALILALALAPLKRPPRYLACLMAAATGFWLVFSLQLAEWLLIHGTIFVQPPAEGFMRWLNPEIGGLLLSARMGLFTWHPVYLVGLLGLRHLFRIDGRLVAAVAALYALQIYVNACVPDWWGGNSFGQRRMLGLLPLLALPLAAFFEATARGRPLSRRVAWTTGALLVFFNGLIFFQYLHQDRFFGAGRFDYPSILSNQLTVLREAPSLVLPYFAETLWHQLGDVTGPGKAIALAFWTLLLAGGLAAIRAVLSRSISPPPHAEGSEVLP